MTNIIKFECPGKNKKEEKKQSIEFIRYLACEEFIDLELEPSNYDHVMLLVENYDSTNYDLIYACDNDNENPCIILGHWNDGIV